MPESLLTILKFLLLALVYLFFLRVLRAVWAEMADAHAPAAAAGPTRSGPRVPQPRGIKGAPGRLRVVEPKEQRGNEFALTDELTAGRAAGCHIRVDDNYASQLHSRIFRKDGQVMVEDLGSTNGTYLSRKGSQARETVTGPRIVRIGDRLLIGNTVLEATK